MLTMIMLVVDAALVLALMYAVGELATLQEEQEGSLGNHEDRINALEEYADYLRSEFMEMKRKVNADNDRADNYVRWRRRIVGTVAGNRERAETEDSGRSAE